MSNLTPRHNPTTTHGSLPAPLSNGLDRRTSRELTSIERQTLTRMASVRGHALVQSEKMAEIDRLAQSAMTGQAMLARWAGTLAQGDPFVTDELRMFSDLAKMAKGEIIADTATAFSREGR